jgi:hypothetical protein
MVHRTGKQTGETVTFIQNNFYHDAFFLKGQGADPVGPLTRADHSAQRRVRPEAMRSDGRRQALLCESSVMCLVRTPDSR